MSLQKEVLCGAEVLCTMECRCQAATCRLCSLKRTCRELQQRLREGQRPLVRAARKAHRVSWPCGLSPKQRHQVLCTYVLSGHNAIVAMQHARQLQRRAASDDTLPSITFVQNLYREAAASDVHACTDPQTAAQKHASREAHVFLAEANLFRWVRQQNFRCHSAPTSEAALFEFRRRLGDHAGCRAATNRGGRKWLQRWCKRWDVSRGTVPVRVAVEPAGLPQKAWVHFLLKLRLFA